jgi:V/A-type H+-transporting ATPase subunit F
MYKIAVIGDRESVLGFKAVGLSVFPVADVETARQTLSDVASGEFAVVYITENVAKDILDDIAKFKDNRIPAIIPIPSKSGTEGIGIMNVKKAVERAVGADILFNND